MAAYLFVQFLSGRANRDYLDLEEVLSVLLIEAQHDGMSLSQGVDTNGEIFAI